MENWKTQENRRKKMKILALLLLTASCWLPEPGYSQTIHYSYGYDESGNRISREQVITYPKKSAQMPKDSLSLVSPKDKVNEVFKDLVENREITIYPNPTKGLLTVEIPLSNNDKARIRLFNIQWKLLIDNNNPGTMTEVDLSGQPAGIYLMQIFVNNKPSTWKIIKQE